MYNKLNLYPINIFLSSDGDHSAIELDVSDSNAVNNLLKTTLQQYKAPPTIIVNSAGITRDNWLLKLSEEDYNNVLSVNLKVKEHFLNFLNFYTSVWESHASA